MACLQATNATSGIEHVCHIDKNVEFKNYFPKHAESLKEVQKVLDLPKLQIVKPSDTCWLAHDRRVQGVKASYSVVVTCLDYIYTDSRETKALGLNKILCKKSTISVSVVHWA